MKRDDTAQSPASQSFWQRAKNVAMQPRTVFWVYVIIVIAASLHKILTGPTAFDGEHHTRFNNFIIFKYAFWHLLQQQDLYVLYPAEHFDLFKYSPTFALLMAPFAVLPNITGLVLWNLLNAMLLFYAVYRLPALSEKTRVLMLWFILLELLTSVQNAQSNGVMAGLIILAWLALENERPSLAALWLVLSVYIKLFGIVAFVLALLYPQRWRFAGYALLWLVVLGALPLLLVSPAYLAASYQGWLGLLAADHADSYGMSVMGILHTWFGWNGDKNVVLAAGVLLFCVPLLRLSAWRDAGFRLLILASVLIWVIIFNHKAESPTYVLAICGAAVWYFPQEASWWRRVLIVLAFVLTSLSPTEIFPAALRHALVTPFELKALPCVLIWLALQVDLLTSRYRLHVA